MKKGIAKYMPGNLILRQEGKYGPLVLGDCNSAVQLAILKPNKVRRIISIGMEARPERKRVPEDISLYFYDIHDNKQQKIPVELFDEVVRLIDEGRQEGGVLVHCYAGVSRSSTFVIAYVMATKHLDYYKAKEFVKKYRPCIHPGDGFIRQLQHYEKVLAQREADRLAELQRLRKLKEEANMTREKIESPTKIEEVKPVLSQRKKRGVRGGVKSADKSPFDREQKSMLQLSTKKTAKIQEREDESGGQSRDRLPPINLRMDYLESRYEHISSSRADLKREIDRIEGKVSLPAARSVGGIYGNKTRVM